MSLSNESELSLGDKVIVTQDCYLTPLTKGLTGEIVDFSFDHETCTYYYQVDFGIACEWVEDDGLVKKYIEPIYPFKEKYMKAYMENALSWAKTSEATRLQVGCIIVDKDGGIIAQGCNGTPSGWHTNICENEDSGETEWFVQHAEVNALNKLRKRSESSVGSIMFVTHSPCKHCALQIIDAKVSHVYYNKDYRDSTGVELLKKYGVIAEQLNV